MPKHIQREELNQYLDGSLSNEERQILHAHLANCRACENKLARESNLRAQVRREFVAIPAPNNGELRGLLPNILNEAQQAPRYDLKGRVLALTVIGVLVLLLPLLPHLDLTDIGNAHPLLNIPLATLAPKETYPAQHFSTIEATDLEQQRLPERFNLEYASPAPPPIATLPPDQAAAP